MKLKSAGWIIVAGLMCLPVTGQADLIEKQFVQPGGTGAATGIVFQGSRNMKHLGKKRRTVSSVIVPSLNPVTVIPALQNEELQPRPRFGYGSDYQTVAASQQRPAPAASTAVSAPVYQFRYSYPVNRDYWITSPYQRYFSPYHSCGHHGGSWWGGGFTRFSISYGW